MLFRRHPLSNLELLERQRKGNKAFREEAPALEWPSQKVLQPPAYQNEKSSRLWPWDFYFLLFCCSASRSCKFHSFLHNKAMFLFRNVYSRISSSEGQTSKQTSSFSSTRWGTTHHPRTFSGAALPPCLPAPFPKLLFPQTEKQRSG